MFVNIFAHFVVVVFVVVFVGAVSCSRFLLRRERNLDDPPPSLLCSVLSVAFAEHTLLSFHRFRRKTRKRGAAPRARARARVGERSDEVRARHVVASVGVCIRVVVVVVVVAAAAAAAFLCAPRQSVAACSNVRRPSGHFFLFYF